MTTDELLEKLPIIIGRNKNLDKDGNLLAYSTDDKKGISIGWLYLQKELYLWCAYYGDSDEFLCLNPDSENPPYNNAFARADTPNEALQKLYDWCIENNFIDIKDTEK